MAENLPTKPEVQIGGQGLVIPPEWGLPIPHADWITTIDATKQEGKKLLLSVFNGEGIKPETTINIPIDAVHIVCQPIEKQINGEMVPIPRICVMLKDNSYVDFRSGGVWKSLCHIFRLERPPPWNPPLKLSLERIALADGKSMYRYQVVRSK